MNVGFAKIPSNYGEKGVMYPVKYDGESIGEVIFTKDINPRTGRLSDMFDKGVNVWNQDINIPDKSFNLELSDGRKFNYIDHIVSYAINNFGSHLSKIDGMHVHVVESSDLNEFDSESIKRLKWIYDTLEYKQISGLGAHVKFFSTHIIENKEDPSKTLYIHK